LHGIHAVKRLWFYSDQSTFFYGIGWRAVGQNLSISGDSVYGIFRYVYHRTDGEKAGQVEYYTFRDDLLNTRDTERKWQVGCDFRAAALVVAGDRVAVSGYDVEGGGVVRLLKAETGEQLAEARVDGRPTHCGLAAAGERLFVSLLEGRVVCLR
jgi:hypothetical protein